MADPPIEPDGTSVPRTLRRPTDEAVAMALGGGSSSDAIVFPRSDGNYPGVTPDVVALLRESGVSVGYATDPATARSWQYKSGIEQVLPAILIAVGDVGTVLSTIDGIVYVVRTILGRLGPRGRVSFDAGRSARPDGTSVEWVTIEAEGDPDTNAEMVKEALRRLFED